RWVGALLLAPSVERAALDAPQSFAHACERAAVIVGAHGCAPLVRGLVVDLRVPARSDVLGHAVNGRLRAQRNTPPLVNGAAVKGKSKKAKGKSEDEGRRGSRQPLTTKDSELLINR